MSRKDKIMKTNIYFFRCNAYNAVVFDQQNGHYFLTEGDHNSFIDGKIDLYSPNAEQELKAYFEENIAAENMDITNLCNSNCVFEGNFEANEEGVEAILLASYDDVDTAEYVDGLI